MQFTKDELNHINAFIYWIKTNTEKGVTTIPRHICNNIIKILESIDKDGIEAREAYSKEIDKLVSDLNSGKYSRRRA